MLKYSLIAGALSSGLEVFDLGQLTTPILRYAVRSLGLHGGVHIFADQYDIRETYIHLVNEKGANLPPSIERKIENLFVRDDYQKQTPDKIRKIRNVNDIPVFYGRSLLNSIDKDAISQKQFKILFQSGDELTASVFYNIARDLNCHIEIADNLSEKMQKEGIYDIGIKMNNNGEILELYDEKGNRVKNEMMLALINLLCLKKNEKGELVIPYNAPQAIEKMAERYQGKVVVRAKSSKQAMMEELLKRGCQSSDSSFDQFLLYFDGMATIVQLMDRIAKEEKSFLNLLEDIPNFYMTEKAIECPWRVKGRVMRSLIEDESRGQNHVELFEGVKINHESGWALILPDSDEPVFRIYSEGVSEEYAEELTNFYENKINEIKSQFQS